METIDPSIGPITEMGLQTANAFLDVGAIKQRLDDNASHTSPYPAGSEENFGIIKDEPVYALMSRDDEYDSRLLIMSSLNALASRVYETFNAAGISAVERAEMARLSVKNSIRYLGYAYGSTRYADGKLSHAGTDCAVGVAGLVSAAVGNGQFGPYMSKNTRIAPGQACEVDVPTVGEMGLRSAGGHHVAEIYRTKYILQLRARDPMNVGHTMIFHYRQLLTRPEKWSLAMATQMYGLRTWLTAARTLHNFINTVAAFAVGESVRAGLTYPSAKALNLYGAAFGPALRAALVKASVILPDDQLPSPAEVGYAADIVTAGLGDHLGVTRLGKVKLPDGDVLLKNLPLRLGHMLTSVDSKGRHNWAYEFGFAPADGGPGGNLFSLRGRMADNETVAVDEPIGSMLHEQLNALSRLFAAVMDAKAQEDRFFAGTALTGGDGVHQKKVVLARGIYR